MKIVSFAPEIIWPIDLTVLKLKHYNWTLTLNVSGSIIMSGGSWWVWANWRDWGQRNWRGAWAPRTTRWTWESGLSCKFISYYKLPNTKLNNFNKTKLLADPENKLKYSFGKTVNWMNNQEVCWWAGSFSLLWGSVEEKFEEIGGWAIHERMWCFCEAKIICVLRIWNTLKWRKRNIKVLN